MIPKRIWSAAAVTFLVSATIYAEETPTFPGLPDFDALRIGFTQTGNMDIDGTATDLSISKYEASAFLSEPFNIFQDLTVIPMFNYSVTQLDFTGPFPIEEEDLHAASLSAIFVKDFSNTPWFAVGYTRAEMATDYQELGGKAFTFDVALGVGYRVSDTFAIGAGFVVTNINGDEEFFPGINFNWKPCDEFTAGLYGANLLLRYDVCETWYLTLDGTPGGGHWNIDAAGGNSRTIRLDSYWLGLNTHHRLTEKLWLSAGVGYTFANEIEIGSNSGSGPSFSRDMDGAALAKITLSLHEW